jgi:hypothetical protein
MLEQWRDRSDAARLSEVLITGFTLDLGFLERFAIPTARALGARITVLADAHQALHDPVDVRRAGVAYQHGHARCPGAFHPKLVVLLGDQEVWLAVGSGNPTASGWGHNQELWLSVHSELIQGPQIVADVATWLADLPGRVEMATWIAATIRSIAERIRPSHIDGTFPHVRALGNLHHPLLDQLPHGPVSDLRLTAPFFDPTGHAVDRIIKRLTPKAVRIGVQPMWTNFDGTALVTATRHVPEREFRTLEQTRTSHGKLIEWTTSDGAITTLTGSANITSSALLQTVPQGGNCELAVLAPTDQTLFPAGTVQDSAAISSHTTRRPNTPSPSGTIVVLGCAIRDGVLIVELADPADESITVETSPSGAPGTWLQIGLIPPGYRTVSLNVPETAGGVVRAVTIHAGQRVESHAVFITDPHRCRPRADVTREPHLANQHSAEDIFTDPQVATRFTTDLERLIAETATAPARATGFAEAGDTTTVDAVTGTDRWRDYLEACDRALGPKLSQLVFPRHLEPHSPGDDAVQWAVEDIDTTVLTDDEDETILDDPEIATRLETNGPAPTISADLRGKYRNWAQRWVAAVTTEREPHPEEGDDAALLPPLPLRMLVTRLYLTLLAAGIWGDDQTWRADLRWLVWALIPYEEEEHQTPPQGLDHLRALLAVAVALLRQDTQLTGGAEHDLLANAAWQDAREWIADADYDLAQALLLPATQAHARVATAGALQAAVTLAAEAAHDPYAEAVADLEDLGYTLTRIGGLWVIGGTFSNPTRAAAVAVTRLGSTARRAAALACAKHRSALMMWAGTILVYTHSKIPLWRIYNLPPTATPHSRTTDVDGPPSGPHGTVPLQPPPDDVTRIADQLNIDLPAAMRRLRAATG